MATVLSTQNIGDDQVTDTKILLANAAYLRGRNAANSADINIVEVNASDRILFGSVPQSPSDASTANDLVRFSQLATLTESIKPKTSVVVASTANINLAVAADPSPIDGHTIANGDRVLLWQQTAPAENGIYDAVTATDPTTWVRSADFNAVSEIPGSYTSVQFGTLYQGVVFVTTSTPVTLGTDPIVFVYRPGAASLTGGDMITVSGGVISVDLATVSGLVSTNPGNAAGQLEIKLEASNPTLQIDGSNQLGAKLNAAGAIVTGASGLAVAVDGTSTKIVTNALKSVTFITDPVFTLSGTDITNKYVDLANPISNVNSVTLTVVQGLMQTYSVDFAASATGGTAGVGRVSWSALGLDGFLVSGNKILIGYSAFV
jgi:hypothetical protein